MNLYPIGLETITVAKTLATLLSQLTDNAGEVLMDTAGYPPTTQLVLLAQNAESEEEEDNE